MLASRHALLLAPLLIALAPRPALADVAGPKTVCDVDGKGCTSCWRPFGNDPLGAPEFERCQQEATGKGLVESCRQRQGAGASVFFCPAGKPIGTTVKGGCGSCFVGQAGGASEVGLLAAMLLTGLGALAHARRARRR